MSERCRTVLERCVGGVEEVDFEIARRWRRPYDRDARRSVAEVSPGLLTAINR